MDRLFERAGHNANVLLESGDGGQAQKAPQMSEEDRMRADTAPMTVQDAGKRINLAWQDRDYFR